MSFYWLTDPGLFLYAKGTGPDDVLLRRCKKSASSSSSSLAVPMKPDDFEFVKIVKNHLELIGDMFDWDEPDYKRLVKYIYEKSLLVNIQGFLIAELLHKADKDGNKMINDANEEEEEVPAIYIRSLDVLPLKPYIPNLRQRPIPLRTVKYFGDVNGKAAPMEEEDSKVTKFTARVDNLEAENIKLTAIVANLEAENIKLTAIVANLEAENTRLESKNNTLDTNITKLTADMVSQMNALATLQRDLIEDPTIKEVWMNDLTNSEWVGIENLSADTTSYDNVTIIRPKGTFTRDDDSTNVQARYWYTMKVDSITTEFKAVSLEDLTPNKGKARFLKTWSSLKSQGKIYILHYL